MLLLTVMVFGLLAICLTIKVFGKQILREVLAGEEDLDFGNGFGFEDSHDSFVGHSGVQNQTKNKK